VALTDSEQNICADLSAVAILATAFGVLGVSIEDPEPMPR
jgi:hypothetical protein